MRFTTRTEYGLVSLVRLVNSQGEGRTTIKQLARQEHYSNSYIEKIFQALRDANIVTSFQGNQGGYALARDPKTITLKEIIDALEGGTFEVFCSRNDVICNHSDGCLLKDVWMKTKELLDAYYGSITLETLAHSARDFEAKRGAMTAVSPRHAAAAPAAEEG